MVVYFGISN